MTIDEFEAIRLIDLESMTQEECADDDGLAEKYIIHVFGPPVLHAVRQRGHTSVCGLALMRGMSPIKIPPYRWAPIKKQAFFSGLGRFSPVAKIGV